MKKLPTIEQLKEQKINEEAFKKDVISKRAMQILRQLVKDGNIASKDWSYPDALAYLEQLGYVSIDGKIAAGKYTTTLTDKGRNYLNMANPLDDDEKLAMSITDPIGNAISTLETSIRKQFQMLVDKKQEAAETLVELAADVIQKEVDAGERYRVTGHTLSDPGFSQYGTKIMNKIKGILAKGRNPYIWGQGYQTKESKVNEAITTVSIDSAKTLFQELKTKLESYPNVASVATYEPTENKRNSDVIIAEIVAKTDEINGTKYSPKMNLSFNTKLQQTTLFIPDSGYTPWDGVPIADEILKKLIDSPTSWKTVLS